MSCRQDDRKEPETATGALARVRLFSFLHRCSLFPSVIQRGRGCHRGGATQVTRVLRLASPFKCSEGHPIFRDLRGMVSKGAPVFCLRNPSRLCDRRSHANRL